MAYVRYAPRRSRSCSRSRCPRLALPFIIRTAVVEGVATATEVSTIGIFYTVLAGLFIYRKFDWRKVYPMLLDTASLSGAILLIVGCATAMAWALTQSGFSHDLVKIMTAVPGGKWGFLRGLGAGLRGSRQRVGRHSGHRAVWTPAVSDRQAGRRQRGALRDGRDLRDGPGVVLSAVRRGLLRGCAIGRVSPDVAIGRVWPHLTALFIALLILIAVPWISIGFL